MRYTISSLSFDWAKVKKLADMPGDFGYEIFWETGSLDNWNHTMEIIQGKVRHPMSIHSPYFFIDLSLPGDTRKIFEELRRPFDFYHKHNGEFYVVHTFDHMTYPYDEQFEEDCRKRTVERLGEFDLICRKEGVRMVAENIAFGNGERYLFHHEQFLDIFRQLPELHCLIDLGHAALTDIDVYKVQQELRDRIVAYHLHDNDGTGDLHQRMGTGIRDWDLFARGVAEYTPGAIGVMEYWGVTNLADYLADREMLEGKIASFGKGETAR